MAKSNVIDLESAMNIRDANEALDEAIDMIDQAIKIKADFDNERKQIAALNKEITLGEEFDSKNIYLTTLFGPGKIPLCVGLHSIGHAGQYQYDVVELDQSRTTKSTDFQTIESWGNEYDPIDGRMMGPGSFRLFSSDIDETAKQYEAEGWIRSHIPPWKKHESKT